MNYRAISTLIGFALCALTAYPAPESYKLDFTAYGLRPGNYNNIYYEDASGEPKPIWFKRKQRTQEYEATILSDKPNIRFLLKTNPPERKESSYKELSIVSIPENPERILFVFMPQKNPEHKKTFRILPIKDKATAGSSGTVRIVNLTNITLLGLVDGDQFQLASMNISSPFQAAKGEPADFSIAAKGNSRYHLVYRNSFRIDSESRAILFLTPPYRKVSLKLGGQMLYEDTGIDSSKEDKTGN